MRRVLCRRNGRSQLPCLPNPSAAAVVVLSARVVVLFEGFALIQLDWSPEITSQEI
jgi:hypothetical protein